MTTRDTLQRLALDIAAAVGRGDHQNAYDLLMLAVRAEREACAAVADELTDASGDGDADSWRRITARDIARAIRSRK